MGNTMILTSGRTISPEEMLEEVELGNFMSRAPMCVLDEAPVSRAFEIFATSQLRHLPVVNMANHCVGMISRHDLVDAQLHEAKYEHKARQKHVDAHILRSQASRIDQKSAKLRSFKLQHTQSNLASISAQEEEEDSLGELPQKKKRRSILGRLSVFKA